jgi:hypothetical protein
MKKVLAVTVFAAFAFASYPAAACDWNREASAQTPVVATTPTTTDQTSQAAPSQPQPTSVVERKPIQEAAPTLIADCGTGNCK